MFNLLPESLKAGIIKEYKLRRFLVFLIFVFIIQVSFVVFMLPSWMISNYKEQAGTERVAELNSSTVLSDTNSIKPLIKSLNSELSIIDKSLEYPKVLGLLDAVLASKSSSIKINQFVFSSNSSSTATISMQGLSATRESLVAFKKSLDDTKKFKSVDLPISNYAKDKNIEFNISISVQK